MRAGGVTRATRRHRGPEEWLARVERDGHAPVEEEALTPRDAAREAYLMGLRLAEGVDTERLARRTGLPFAESVDLAALRALEDEGYLARTGTRLRATEEGRLRLDAVLPALLV